MQYCYLFHVELLNNQNVPVLLTEEQESGVSMTVQWWQKDKGLLDEGTVYKVRISRGMVGEPQLAH